jgi:dTDP-4-dehydrorhamnose 3,5-epimerase
MIYTKTALAGVLVVDIQKIEDERGFFAYGFDAAEAAEHGIQFNFVQAKISFNHRRGTVRGMHWQVAPSTETKLIRCTRGAIHDVVVDVRPQSPTFGRHIAVELSADNHRALYIPGLFAHGYQTLVDSTEVTYQVDAAYAPKCERGLRFDDPALAIHWPLPVSMSSPRDQRWPLLSAQKLDAGGRWPG